MLLKIGKSEEDGECGVARVGVAGVTFDVAGS